MPQSSAPVQTAQPATPPAEPAAPMPSRSAVPAQKMVGVPAALADAVLQYLSTQPYNQVVGLISNLQQCQIFTEEETTP